MIVSPEVLRLAASVFHFWEIAIPELKRTLRENNINVRL